MTAPESQEAELAFWFITKTMILLGAIGLSVFGVHKVNQKVAADRLAASSLERIADDLEGRGEILIGDGPQRIVVQCDRAGGTGRP